MLLKYSLALALLFAVGSIAFADDGGVVRGMFGDRYLGGFQEPKAISPGSGLVVAPSGVFLGRGGVPGRMMFSGMPWHYQGPWKSDLGFVWLPRSMVPVIDRREPPRVEVVPVERPVVVPAVPAQPAAPPPTPVPPLPDEWLRTPNASRIEPPTPPPTTQSAPGPGPTRVTVGFRAPVIPSQSDAALTALLNSSRRIQRLSPVTVLREGDIAVLRGRVATEEDRLLAEAIVSLEAGVWQIRNELIVPRIASR